MPTFCISIQAKSVSLNEVLSNHGLKEKYNFQEKTKTYFDIFKAFFTQNKTKQKKKQTKKKKKKKKKTKKKKKKIDRIDS